MRGGRISAPPSFTLADPKCMSFSMTQSPSITEQRQRAIASADQSALALEEGDLQAALDFAKKATLADKLWSGGHYRRSKVYQAMGSLEKSQEAAMHAYLLARGSEVEEELLAHVKGLTHDIARTDYGPSIPSLSNPNLIAWNEDEAPMHWYQKQCLETLEKSLPLTALYALECAIKCHLLPSSILSKERLCLHLPGSTSEFEDNSNFSLLFDKLPKLRELELVQVGYMGMIGPMRSLVPDQHAPPPRALFTQREYLGQDRRLIIRKWQGPYHDFLAQATRHQIQGFLHEAPDLVLIANPNFNTFFDTWVPTLTTLRDSGYLTIITGGNFDHSRPLHNIILQVLHARVVMRLRTSRFGINHAQRIGVKNHNLIGFRGPAILLTMPIDGFSLSDLMTVRQVVQQITGMELSGARRRTMCKSTSRGELMEEKGEEEEGRSLATTATTTGSSSSCSLSSFSSGDVRMMEEGENDSRYATAPSGAAVSGRFSAWRCRSFRRGEDGRLKVLV